MYVSIPTLDTYISIAISFLCRMNLNKGMRSSSLVNKKPNITTNKSIRECECSFNISQCSPFPLSAKNLCKQCANWIDLLLHWNSVGPIKPFLIHDLISVPELCLIQRFTWSRAQMERRFSAAATTNGAAANAESVSAVVGGVRECRETNWKSDFFFFV